MKKHLLFLVFLFLIKIHVFAHHVLTVNEVIQERDQWCWAASSKCILDYYGFPKSQCAIAEYARSVITWRSFGTMDCCIDPDMGCNYWNYLFGAKGSIEDILKHFGTIQNNPVHEALSLTDIKAQIDEHKCFVVRWGWASGGGHFVVGHGLKGKDVYYMDPWFGEGLHIGTYDWLVNDGNHTWTHSDTLDISKLDMEAIFVAEQKIIVYPNPTNSFISISSQKDIEQIQLIDLTGRPMKQWKDVAGSTEFDLADLASGVYYLQIESEGYVEVQKIIKY